MSASDGHSDSGGSRRSRGRTSILRTVGIGLLVAIAAVALFAGVGAADDHYSPDQFEPNEGVDEAAPVSEGSYDGLTIHEGDEGDIYAIDLEEGVQLEAEIAFSHAEGDLELGAADPNEEYVSYSYSTTDDETVTFETNQAGTYYLVVFGAGEDVTNAYDLEVSVDTSGGSDDGSGSGLSEDRFEPNDEFGTATFLEEGFYDGLTVRNGNSDYYAIDLEEGDRLETWIDFAHADGDLDLTVYDPNQDYLDSSTSTSAGEAVTVEAAQSGTYYVEVYGYSGASNEYNFEVFIEEGAASDDGPGLDADRFESNDDFGEAAPIDAGWYSDLTVRNGGVDFYAIDLEEGDRLETWIDFANAESNLDLVVYDPDRRVLEVSDSTTNNFEDVTAEASQSGTHYVAVYDAGGNSNQYNLEAIVEEGAASDDGPELDADRFEPNDYPEEATPIDEGFHDGLTLRSGGDDLYAIDLGAGDRLEAGIGFDQDAGDLDLLVMDPTNDIVDYSASPTDGEELTFDAEHDGTHYVIVTGADNSASNEYALEVNVEAGAGSDPGTPNDGGATDPNADRFEPNDDFDVATPIEEGTHPDLNVRDGSSDYYAIDVVEGARLEASIDFAHADGDLDLAVHSPSQYQLDGSASVSDGETVAAEASESGTYYVEVYGWSGASNEYDLEISLEKPRYDLSVDESDGALTEGETLAVTVEYTNVGELAGAGDIELVVDGETVDSTTANLATGTSGEATLEWEVDDADVETVSVRSGDDEETVIDRTEDESDESADGNESDDSNESTDGDDESDDGMPLNPALAVVALVATTLVLVRRA